MAEQEKSAAELQEEERQAAIARGDIIEEGETLEASEEPMGKDDGAGTEKTKETDIDVEEEEEEVIEAEDSGDDDDELEARTESDGPEEEKPIMIPKSRFDEAQQKARQRQEDLEERLNKFEAQEKRKQESVDLRELRTEIETLKDEYETYVFEGEPEKAKEARRKLEQKQEDLFDVRLQQQNQQTQQQTVEQMRFDTQLAQVEAKYPALNPDSPDFNENQANEVADMMHAFQRNGYTATAALQKSIHYIMRDEPADPGEDLSNVTREKRAVQARKKAVKAVQQTPPALSKAGLDSDKAGADDDGLPDPMKLTEKQFEKLSEKQLSKLRGDSYA